MPRLYVAEQLHSQPPGWLVKLDATESKHTKSLRLQQGARIELCDGRGSVVLAEIAGHGRDGAVARTLSEATQVGRRLIIQLCPAWRMVHAHFSTSLAC